jgi:hypothetical protein
MTRLGQVSRDGPYSWDYNDAVSKHVTSLAAALLTVFASAALAEERISNPSSGPLGAPTYGLATAGTAHGDVAVWFSSSVAMSSIDASGEPSEVVRVAFARENRPPQVLGSDESLDVFWAEDGTLFTRRYSAMTLEGEEPRIIATFVDYPSVARNGNVIAIAVDPWELGSTIAGSTLLLLDEDGNETRRVSLWPRKRAFVTPLGDGFISMQPATDGIWLKRLTAEGEIIDSSPIRAADATMTSGFVSSGERAWVVTRASGASAPFHVLGIDPDGSVAVSRAVPVPTESTTTNGVALRARADGLVILAGLGDDVWRMRLAVDGSEAEPPRRVVEAPGRQWVRGISSGSRELIFWSESELFDIFVHEIDREPRVLTSGGSSASGLSAAASDDAILVAWRDGLGTAHTYRYSMLDSRGRPSGEPVTFDSGDGFNGDPLAAWSGEDLGILWRANQRTQLLRLAPDGTPRGPAATLSSVPATARLAGGHGQFVALWTSDAAIVASVLGEDGPSEPVTLTTPVPLPPNAVGSGDAEPILLATPDGFELVYENTVAYGCVGIPCPTETSVYVVRLSMDLEPDLDSRTLVAADAQLTDAAVSDGVLGVLATRIDLELCIVPRGAGSLSTRTLWQRTGFQPLLGTARIGARPSGFVVALRSTLGTVGWTTFLDLAHDGTEQDLRVLSGRTGQTRIVRTGSSDVVAYSRGEGESRGSSVYSARWNEAPPGPALPATPLRVIARPLTPPFVHVTWTYEGPPLAAFTISTGPYERVTVLAPDVRSTVFIRSRPMPLRVVAVNEAGSSASKAVEPKPERMRGVRR